MKKFVMLDRHTLPDSDFHQEMDLLRENGFDCILAECRTQQDAVAYAGDADCIGVNYFLVTEELLQNLPNCKAVLRYGIGYDAVDVEACTRREIMVCNLPDYCIEDVAAHTMALLLNLINKVTLLDRQTRAGQWDVAYGYDVRRMSALTIGLMGFGNIARLLSSYIKPFGARMIAYDPFVPERIFGEFGVEKVSLEELLSSADAISVHTPVVPDTYHLICRETIEKMKDGVLLVNTSRGGIIDTPALIEALHSGKVGAAGLDVVEGEPIEDPTSPLWTCETLVVTPHSAAHTIEAAHQQHMQVAQAAVAVLSGNLPKHIVNGKQLGIDQ